MFNFDQHHHLSLVARPIRLSDVFLSAHFGPTKPHCVIYPDGVRALVLNRSKYLQFLCRKPLDELEYGLGAERGWLLACLSRESEHFAVIWEDMHEDVWELFMTGQIALLPDADSLSKIRALLQHNFRCLLRERRAFFEDLPFTEYTYKLLPPVRPKPLPLYINDAFPSPLPLTEAIVKIQSRLHACFLLNSSASCVYRVLESGDLGWCRSRGLKLWDDEESRKYAGRRVVHYRPDLVSSEVQMKVGGESWGRT